MVSLALEDDDPFTVQHLMIIMTRILTVHAWITFYFSDTCAYFVDTVSCKMDEVA